LSELQSAGIGRCDGSPEKISMSKREQKNYVRKKHNIENESSLVGSENHQTTCESSVTALADFDLRILRICFKRICMFPSNTIDSFASFDFNSASFLYNE
jgi:hypothetical protein